MRTTIIIYFIFILCFSIYGQDNKKEPLYEGLIIGTDRSSGDTLIPELKDKSKVEQETVILKDKNNNEDILSKDEIFNLKTDHEINTRKIFKNKEIKKTEYKKNEVVKDDYPEETITIKKKHRLRNLLLYIGGGILAVIIIAG